MKSKKKKQQKKNTKEMICVALGHILGCFFLLKENNFINSRLSSN